MIKWIYPAAASNGLKVVVVVEFWGRISIFGLQSSLEINQSVRESIN